MRVERVTTLLYNEVVTLFLGGERMLQFEHIANHWRKRMWKNHFAENDKPID